MVSCLQPEDLAKHVADHMDEPLYQVAPAEGNKPCSIFNVETRCFPFYFPNGKGGFNDHRNSKLGLNRYFNSRLFSSDFRFARDPQYIFYAQYVSEVKQISSSISIAMRKASAVRADGTKLTAGLLKDSSTRKNIFKADEGYKFFKSIRGSPAYWENCLRDLFAMVRQLGKPTFFMSFSAADRRWKSIVEAICLQQGETLPSQIDWSTHCRIINSNPVTACRMFEYRVQSFITNVIKSPAHPIGKVTDYFLRTEFQSRGWPHIHCLFWVENAPQFKSDSNNADLVEFIDRYITCCLPDKTKDAELYEIVTNVQIHSKNHSRSCKKKNMTCRFNFPRPPSSCTFIAQPRSPPENVPIYVFKSMAQRVMKHVWDEFETLEENDTVTASDLLRQSGVTSEQLQTSLSILAKRNKVYYKRDCNECWVNPYNRTLIKAWDGNMDIQPVLDTYSCIMYIVSYISKAERELGDLLKRAQDEAKEGNKEPIKQLRELGNVYLHHREVSVMEAVYRVCGMNLKQCSRQVVFVPTDHNAIRYECYITLLYNITYILV